MHGDLKDIEYINVTVEGGSQPKKNFLLMKFYYDF